ncbi:MAG: Hsp70 family protein [Limnohabitans sp.]|nr:Hsp70 family protein [Limnohabitans sp.]
MENINFGIDLGTTNSGICKFEDGKIQIFKNPVGFSDTLPSAISFRKSRISIGGKAREMMGKTNTDVFTAFKRKMGTDHQYLISETNESKSAIDLSAMILKELSSFVTDEKIESVIITIPASFDTIQSNATKKAGHQAGFSEVVLLQEPIAACLAYANYHEQENQVEKNWLVYDFGGGTFDTALVKINERELKVIDHQGNNFLGGVDLDHLLIEKLITPSIEDFLGESDLYKKMMSSTDSSYHKLYYELLYKAEEIKKELSIKESVTTELELNDGDDLIEFTVTRKDFNEAIHKKVEESIELIHKLLFENEKSITDIERIILVGGTTYIPYIRERLKEVFNITVDNSIDPTTAVMVGAAYYAGSKAKEVSLNKLQEIQQETPNIENTANFQVIYETNTQDNDELISVISNSEAQFFYRIIRKDGGFDTGITSFQGKFNEFVKILPKSRNQFFLTIFDQNQNMIYENKTIFINHGVYNISGQPLPNDICLEVDDSFGETYLEKIFSKNDILPLSKTIYKTTSKNFIKDSNDKLIINVTEGKSGTLPGSNMTIGYIEINSKEMPHNLLKGMDIEIKFAISESRDLTVSVYISSIDFEIKEVFNPHSKSINKNKFLKDIDITIREIDTELDNAEFDEDNYAYYGQLKKIKDELVKIDLELIEVEENESTERIFQLDERKRTALQQYDGLMRHKAVIAEIEEYNISKASLITILDDASPRQAEQFQKIVKNEKYILESNEKSIIKGKIKELDLLYRDIYYKKDESYANLYYHYKYKSANEYSNPLKLNQLIEAGDKAIEQGNFKEVKYIVYEMYNLLIVKPKDSFEDKDGNLGLK